MNEYLWLIIAYIIGSIPFSLIIGMLFKKTDIRNHGSGNLGGTNAVRVLGSKYGVPAGILDILKAFVIVLLAVTGVIEISYSPVFLGVAATIGHCYPVFAGFRGGKAVSTTMGTLFAFAPIIATIALAIALIIIFTIRYVSLGSTALSLAALIIMIFIPSQGVNLLAYGILVIFILYRHIPNYRNLVNGKESKFYFKKN